MRIGFIGAGKMAEALIKGVISAGVAPAASIVASNRRRERSAELAERYGVGVTQANREVVELSDVVVLGVKPQQSPGVLSEIGATFSDRKLLISIMAGVRSEAIEAKLPEGTPVIRAMPNIGCVVREAVTAVSPGRRAAEGHLDVALRIFSAVGLAVRIDESLMDAVTGLSGSGTAFVLTALEALADGGVRAGIARDVALKLAAQTALGMAKLVLEGHHPAILREQVTSPAGTTAEGLAVLESMAVRHAFAEAVRAAAARAKSLGEGK